MNNVSSYGWSSSNAPCSSSYLEPKVLQILNELSARRVVDLGSGNGHLCSVLHANDFQVAGVEYDKGGVEVSRDTYPQIPFYNYGVEDDPSDLLLHEEKFDAVVSTEVIEHLYSPHLLPEFAREILNDAGYLIVSTPYHGYLKNILLSIFDKWDSHHTPLWHGGHIKFWSRRTLSSLLENHGFNVVAFTGVGRAPFIWKSMIIIAQKVL